jgi:hypothetical protein
LVFKNSSRYPDAEVRALVVFALKGLDTRRLAVNIKNAVNCAFRGRAYRGIPRVSPYRGDRRVTHLMTVGIGAPWKFPALSCYHHQKGMKSAPGYRMECWREALVAVAAHEARHIHQFRRALPASEVDTERWAAKRLDAYRKMRGLPR